MILETKQVLFRAHVLHSILGLGIHMTIWNRLYKDITGPHNGTKSKALACDKFGIFPLICSFRILYYLRPFSEKNSNLLTVSYLFLD